MMLPGQRPWKIVREGLCVRCGACVGLCPRHVLTLDADGFPAVIRGQRACRDCGACMAACPAHVDFPGLSQAVFGEVSAPRDAVGIVRRVCVGRTTDPEIWRRSASGGVATGLLISMLARGEIADALVCEMDPGHPCEPRSFLARTREEILRGAQSKYTVVPHLRLLGEVARGSRPAAIVGLPCHLHAYRTLAQAEPATDQRVVLAIGLACHSALEPAATQELLAVRGISPENVARLEYRGGDAWPGGIRATLADGRVCALHPGHIKYAFNLLHYLYAPPRCLACIDFSAEFSDLTVMDPWIRDETGRHPYPGGWSLVLVRTARGEEALARGVADGSLEVQDVPRRWLPSQFDPMVRHKKIEAPMRIERLRRQGRPFPQYRVEFPPAAIGPRLAEGLNGILRRLGAFRVLRRLAMRLAFSRAGEWAVAWSDRRKARQAASGAHRPAT